MTVNELIQKLVELARDGKGQWTVRIPKYDLDSSAVEDVAGICELDIVEEIIIQ